MKEPQKPQEGHLTPAEAAAILQVSADTVRRHGHRLGQKVLGRWRLDPAAVKAASVGALPAPN